MRRILSFLFVLLLTSQAFATHFRGGEISWQCVGSGIDKGKLIFTVKLWRGCASGTAGLGTSVSLSNPLYAQNGGVATIYCGRVSMKDISPTCVSPISEIACGQPFASGGGQAYEENLYVSAAVPIYGTPSANGSEFYYNTCCRVNVANGSGSNFYLSATMYPYTDPNTNQTLSLGNMSSGADCYDNSPVFAEKVPYLGVLGKLNYFTAKSIDVDCDSVVYDFSTPRLSATANATWGSGYSANSPLPGTSSNANNVNISMNSQTGIGSYKVIGANGIYQICHKAISYRNGQKVAEVYRDYAMLLEPNTIDSFAIINENPSIYFKLPSATTYSTSYSDTFDVGQTVELNLLATDLDYNDAIQKQKVSLRLVADNALDGGFNPYGCKFSNCAGLDSTTANWVGGKFESTDSVTANFEWTLDCEHLIQCQSSDGLNKEYITYTFLVVAMDDNCDKPLNAIKSFSITIRDTLVDDAPIREISYSGTDATIKWDRLISPQFYSYNIYRVNLSDGIYVLLDSITNLLDTSFTDTLGIDSVGVRYRLIPHVGFSCDNQNNTYDAIILNADTVNGIPEIEWNAMFKLAGNGNYGYYILQTDTGSGWMLLDSSSSLSYTHSSPGCSNTLKYRVLAYDTINDVQYISNIDSVFQDHSADSNMYEICDGDSVLITGAYRYASGIYKDSNNTSLGCKVYIINDLFVNPVYEFTDSEVEICSGDSIFIAGAYRNSAGTYFETFTTSKGCDSTHHYPLKVRSIDTSISVIATALTANSKGKQYQWFECPSLTPIPSANLVTYIATKNGSYGVAITDGACVDSSSCYEITGIGINELENDLEVMVFPNPVNDVLTIQLLNENNPENFTFEFYNSEGKSFYQNDVKASQIDLDVSSWSEGVYYYNISMNGKILYRSAFVKSR